MGLLIRAGRPSARAASGVASRDEAGGANRGARAHQSRGHFDQSWASENFSKSIDIFVSVRTAGQPSRPASSCCQTRASPLKLAERRPPCRRRLQVKRAGFSITRRPFARPLARSSAPRLLSCYGGTKAGEEPRRNGNEEGARKT